MFTNFNQVLFDSLPLGKFFPPKFALIKFGGGVVQMSGSIAGNTFARNRYGNYVRARTKPTNPNTARQQTVRSAMALLTTRWSQTLTALQRAAWNLYGSNVNMLNKLGETIQLSGFNHYIRSNLPLIQIVATPVDDGPVIFELPAADPTYALAASEATQVMTLTYDAAMAWATETGGYLFHYQGQPQNAQRNFFAGPWRLIGRTPGVDGAPPASPDLIGVQFAIAELQHLWVYARIARVDGRISLPFRANIMVAA